MAIKLCCGYPRTIASVFYAGNFFETQESQTEIFSHCTMATEGRYYEAEFPEMEEIVVVQVKRIVDMGAYVSLLEYDNQEAFHCLCCICTFYFCHQDLFATR